MAPSPRRSQRRAERRELAHQHVGHGGEEDHRAAARPLPPRAPRRRARHRHRRRTERYRRRGVRRRNSCRRAPRERHGCRAPHSGREVARGRFPDYLARHGEPKTPADLHRHACINWRFPGSGRIDRWQFEKKGKKLNMAVEGPLISNHQDIVVEGPCRASDSLRLRRRSRQRGDGARAAQARAGRLVADESRPLPLLFESPPCSTCAARLH